MRRRPSRLMTATAAIMTVRLLVVAGCEAKVYGTPPPARWAAADRRRAAGQLGPAARGAARRAGRRRSPASTTARGRPPPRPRRPVPTSRRSVLDRNTGQLVTNGNGTTIADRLGGQAVHRRRPAAAGVQGPDQALARRPQCARRHAAVIRRQRRRDLLEPQRRQRDHQPGGRPLRAGVHAAARQRPLVQHHQHGGGPGALLRHAAGGHRRVAARAGQHHHGQPGRVHPDRRYAGGVTRNGSASRRASSPNRSRSSRAGCAASAPTGCTCPPVSSAPTAAMSWPSARCSRPATTPPAQTITQAVKTMFPGGD